MADGYSELKTLAKGIQIAVEKGEGGSENEAVVIKTKHGDCEVVAIGDRKKPALVTYPDGGSNFDSCFKSFFQFCGSNSCFKHFYIVHVNPPGQHYGSSELPAQLTMEALRESFEKVLEEMKISSFYGMGVGTGAYVMLDLASRQPKRLMAMILINPTAQKSWYVDWAYEKMNLVAHDYFKYDRWWKDQFMQRWFHALTRKEHTDLLELHEKLFWRMNQANVKNIEKAFTKRPDITKELKEIKCRVLMVVSDGGVTEMEAFSVMGAMQDNHHVTWTKINNAGVMLTEEAPHSLLHPINLFFAGSLGTLVSKEMLDYSRKLQEEGYER